MGDKDIFSYYSMMCFVDNDCTILPMFIKYLWMILISYNWGLCSQKGWVFLTNHFVFTQISTQNHSLILYILAVIN